MVLVQFGVHLELQPTDGSNCYVCDRSVRLSAQCREVGQVLLALRDAPLAARLVLGRDQAVRRPAAQHLCIDVGAGTAELIPDVRAVLLGHSQRPGLAGTVRQKSS